MSSCDGGPRAALIVDSELRELARVSAWVRDWAEGQGLSARLASRIDLCSCEVVTNIMTHAAGPAETHITLHLDRQGADVALDVQDEGGRFDPRQVPQPVPATSLQDARVGGWGIPILRRFSDELHYRHEDGRNCLTLLFRATESP
jgi:serine/threonine-protein kinase RsbW